MKRASEICNGLVDILGYIGTEWEGSTAKQYLYTRQTPTLFAGSRFPYLKGKIPFGYDNLVNAIVEAIDESGKGGATIVDSIGTKQIVSLDYNTLMSEAKALWGQLVGETDPDANAPKILKKIEMIFGRKLRLSEIVEGQEDLLELVLIDMREMAK